MAAGPSGQGRTCGTRATRRRLTPHGPPGPGASRALRPAAPNPPPSNMGRTETARRRAAGRRRRLRPRLRRPALQHRPPPVPRRDAVVWSIDEPVWRADLFGEVGGEPFDAAHFHPTFSGLTPCERVFDPAIQDDPLAWIARLTPSGALTEALSARLREQTTDEWLDKLRGDVPCAPVRDLEDALDPRAERRGLTALERLIVLRFERQGAIQDGERRQTTVASTNGSPRADIAAASTSRSYAYWNASGGTSPKPSAATVVRTPKRYRPAKRSSSKENRPPTSS